MEEKLHHYFDRSQAFGDGKGDEEGNVIGRSRARVDIFQDGTGEIELELPEIDDGVEPSTQPYKRRDVTNRQERTRNVWLGTRPGFVTHY